jgi:hypothetical protein
MNYSAPHQNCVNGWIAAPLMAVKVKISWVDQDCVCSCLFALGLRACAMIRGAGVAQQGRSSRLMAVVCFGQVCQEDGQQGTNESDETVEAIGAPATDDPEVAVWYVIRPVG